MKLPYSTPDLPGVGGTIKTRDEDFFVQEIPLYEASGEGEHVYCEIQKVGITTFAAIHSIADALGVSSRDIGYAGMKDAHAVTRQTLSIWGTTPEAVMDLKLPGITVQWASRHVNKLRLGHLVGNRFAIKIRDVEPTHVVRAKAIMKVLETRGVPNFFGEQRFGRRGNNDKIGAALIRNDNIEILRLLLGDPREGLDDPKTLHARAAFEKRDNETAMKFWPRNAGMERRVLARLMKTHKPSAAVRSIDEKIRRLWVSALQSKLFNDVLAARINSFDKVELGDLAWKHETGSVFRVEDLPAETTRAAAFEISPTGPLIGYRMTLPEGHPLEVEQSVFTTLGLAPDAFRQPGQHRIKGARRPLRVRPTDTELSAGVDDDGAYITVAFTLPAGSFATVVLGEVMKAKSDEAQDDTTADEDTADLPETDDA
ncbi:MAG TPA: tRNA pseudouridine(13) synthase TruD [Tepidisphaeraceae bacterium]|jgi:tRNA pseudouridine13 synthase|nr:tRNA pseudouridine(13) synthase TruD [Tepidisphaeraceae bacterium]